MNTPLARRLGLGDAVVIGLGSMIGAGVFSAFGPAAAAAGSGMLIGLVIAGFVAYCNATSSARLAAIFPQSGGTYVYGRERLGPFWGYLAGWSFVVGKTASCAAMALTIGAYLWPEHDRWIAVLAVVAITGVNYFGVRKSLWLTRIIVAFTLVTLVVVVLACVRTAQPEHLTGWLGDGVYGILQSAGLLFFAMAGYARIATMGEEVKRPAWTIPRAIPIALAITLVVYLVVAVAVLAAVGAEGIAGQAAPLQSAVAAGSWNSLAPAVRAGAVVAAFGSLLSLTLGVSRTTLAMARDRYLPTTLGKVHPRFGVPHHAELAIAAVVIVLVLTTDIRGTIGFSSFGVLVYYAIANASALTLNSPSRGRRLLPVLGLAGCLILAGTLPWTSVVAGAGVVLAGAAVFVVTRTVAGRRLR